MAAPRAALLAVSLLALTAPLGSAQGIEPGKDGAEAERFERGVAQFKRTCQQCHGRDMVNAGATVYDLRRFPVDDRERFFNSVTNGKGNMPSFKDALTLEQITVLWTYVKNRGKAVE